MSSKRKSTSSATSFNFRPQNEFQKRGETKGIKPLPEPISVGRALLAMIIHVCRKIMFVNTHLKIGVYIGIIFFSFIWDFAPFPRSYFSQSSNVFNQYFVKWGWAWTLVVTLPFVLLTSFTYSCGNRRMVGWHLARIGIATAVWFTFTKSFVFIENNTGKCNVKSDKFPSKQLCLSAGHFWQSLDISGHSFILIYSCLVIIEEARAIIGWETIEDMLRNEEHQRAIGETDLSSPVKNLSNDELYVVRVSFNKFSPYVRGLFVAMTLLTVLWDTMILSTAFYFHIMIEKLIGGILAAAVWFFTYEVWYKHPKTLPNLPGQGVFQYSKKKLANSPLPRAAYSRVRPEQGPMFMGMPLFTAKPNGDAADGDDTLSNGKNSSTVRSSNPQISPRLGPITRSQSKIDG